ncbi:hypothetical protein LTR28_011998, partial [Elasticomyces elasticus]
MPHSVDADLKLLFEQQSRSSRRSSAFPKAAGTEIVGATLALPNKNEDTSSHLHSDFSFEDQSKPPSPVAEAYNDLIGRSTITTDTTTHGAGGDKQEMNGNYHAEHDSKRRTAYYDEQFAYKDGGSGTARERVQKDSPVIAELRTNVIIKDEYTLVTDLSYHLSTRFARPESSIMINVDHSACLLLSGSFEPAYILTICALPSLVQPTTNKRNAAMIQSFMSDILSVAPDRGILKFTPIAEENLATDGATMLGEIERLEKLQAEGNGAAAKRVAARSSRKSMSAAKNKPERTDKLAAVASNGAAERRHSLSKSSPLPVAQRTAATVPALDPPPSRPTEHSNPGIATGLNGHAPSRTNSLTSSSDDDTAPAPIVPASRPVSSYAAAAPKQTRTTTTPATTTPNPAPNPSVNSKTAARRKSTTTTAAGAA